MYIARCILGGGYVGYAGHKKTGLSTYTLLRGSVFTGD
jgi:hypothetical protein